MLEQHQLAGVEPGPVRAQLGSNRRAGNEEGAGETAAGLLLVEVIGEPTFEDEVTQLVGRGEALPISRAVRVHDDHRQVLHGGGQPIEPTGARAGGAGCDRASLRSGAARSACSPGVVGLGGEDQETSLFEGFGEPRNCVETEGPGLPDRLGGDLDLVQSAEERGTVVGYGELRDRPLGEGAEQVGEAL